MADWQSVGAVDMLAEGAMREVNVGGQTLLLARVQGRYYATQGLCPHLRAHLARGQLRGAVVTCPWHGSQFDVTDGRNLAWIEGLPGLVRSVAQALAKPKGLATFAVKVEDGQVWVKL
jgi:nitrite reductase/ring-hydroxylating ferredoxin subunit